MFTGVGEGAPPRVRAYFAETGKLNYERTPFDAGFVGGVRVAAGDVNHDSWPDLIAAAGPGGGPHVKVLDGKTGEPIAGPLGSFFAYDPGFQGGVWVAGGDADGDGWADVITAAGGGGAPHVKVFSGRTGQEVASFLAFAPEFRGGATVAAADFTGDGRVDLAVGAGAGGKSEVRVFDLGTGKTIAGPLGDFSAFDAGFAGGVTVGTDWKTGDVTGDGVPDLVVGAGAGGAPHVKVFDGASGQVVRSFLAFDAGMTAGARVATAFVTDDKYADIVVGSGSGPAATAKVFDGRTGAELAAPLSGYQPFGAAFTGGLFVAASNDPPQTLYTGTFTWSTTPNFLYPTAIPTAEVTETVTTAPDESGDYVWTYVVKNIGSGPVHEHYDFRVFFPAGAGLGADLTEVTPDALASPWRFDSMDLSDPDPYIRWYGQTAQGGTATFSFRTGPRQIVTATGQVIAQTPNGGIGATGSLVTPGPPNPGIMIVGDTNRDGSVTSADDQDRNAWTKTRGAIYAVNYDDNPANGQTVGDEKPDAIDFDVYGKPINENFVFESDADAAQSAPLVIRPIGTWPAGYKVILKVKDKSQSQAIHVFSKREFGAAHILGSIGDRVGKVDGVLPPRRRNVSRHH